MALEAPNFGGNIPGKASGGKHLPPLKKYAEPLAQAITGAGEMVESVEQDIFVAQQVQGIMKEKYNKDPIGHHLAEDIKLQIKGFVKDMRTLLDFFSGGN